MLLAAGKSGRMGKSKLLLPWAGTSVVGHQLHTWQQLRPGQIAVVRAEADQALLTELDRLGVARHDQITNPRPELGMFSSIRCAAQWRGWDQGLTHWVITLGDQPHLRLETLRTLLHFSATNPDQVCQPRRLGWPHHPVVLPRKFFLELGVTPAHTLKDYLAGIPGEVTCCEIDDAGLELDLDTPADYARALARFSDNASGPDARAAGAI